MLRGKQKQTMVDEFCGHGESNFTIVPRDMKALVVGEERSNDYENFVIHQSDASDAFENDRSD